MKDFIHSSSKEGQAGDKINVERYRLSSETDNKPCFFEIIFVHNDIKYRYGFTADQNRIYTEWLHQTEKTKEVELFYRSEDGTIDIGSKFKSPLPIGVFSGLKKSVSKKLITIFVAFKSGSKYKVALFTLPFRSFVNSNNLSFSYLFSISMKTCAGKA